MKWKILFEKVEHDKFQSTSEKIIIEIDTPDGYYLSDFIKVGKAK